MAQRPDRRPAVTSLPRVGVLAAAVVLAVVLARARAAGVTPTPPDATRELVRSVLQVLTITLLTVAVVLLAGFRGERVAAPAGGTRRKPKPVAADRRRLLLAVLIGLAVAAVAQVVGGLLNDPSAARPPVPPPAAGADVRESPWPGERPRPGAEQDDGVGDTVVLAVLLVAMGAVGLMLLRARASGSDGAEDEPEEEAQARRAAIARAVRAGRDAVRDSAELDPRQAIVACFAAMEDALREQGEHAAPRPADTPLEVLTRGVAHARLPEAPARTLLELFREARFSTHPMSEDHRAAADRALAALLAALGPTQGSATGGTGAP